MGYAIKTVVYRTLAEMVLIISYKLTQHRIQVELYKGINPFGKIIKAINI